jgi:hypothetical protein
LNHGKTGLAFDFGKAGNGIFGRGSDDAMMRGPLGRGEVKVRL